MGKGIIEFDLPEEQCDMENALLANKVFTALWEFDQYLREQYKYNDVGQAWDVRERFREILLDNEINIEGGKTKTIKRKWWQWKTK